MESSSFFHFFSARAYALAEGGNRVNLFLITNQKNIAT